MSVESDNGSASAGTVDATGDTGGTSRGKVQLAGGTTTSTNAGGETIIALGIVADTASGTAMIKTENAGASGVSGLINMITGDMSNANSGSPNIETRSTATGSGGSGTISVGSCDNGVGGSLTFSEGSMHSANGGTGG